MHFFLSFEIKRYIYVYIQVVICLQLSSKRRQALTLCISARCYIRCSCCCLQVDRLIDIDGVPQTGGRGRDDHASCVTSANRSRSPRSTSGSVRSIPGAEVRSETQRSKRQPSAAGPRKRWCRDEDDAVRMAGSLFPTSRVVLPTTVPGQGFLMELCGGGRATASGFGLCKRTGAVYFSHCT